VSKSSSSRASRKDPDRPKKPYPDFHLTPHPTGTWQKKIGGKIDYFGKWTRQVDGVLTRIPGDGWEGALAEYKKVADDLHAGRTPREQGRPDRGRPLQPVPHGEAAETGGRRTDAALIRRV
jgi:hypothetical protein